MTSYNVTITGEGDMEMERKFGWTGGVEGQPLSTLTFSFKTLTCSVLFTQLDRRLESGLVQEGCQTSTKAEGLPLA